MRWSDGGNSHARVQTQARNSRLPQTSPETFTRKSAIINFVKNEPEFWLYRYMGEVLRQAIQGRADRRHAYQCRR